MLQRIVFVSSAKAFCLLCLFCFAAQFGSGQIAPKQEAAMLETGKSIARAIAAAERHEYQVVLNQNQCLEFTISGRDDGVILSVTAPGGGQLMEFNAPDAEGAPQPILIVAETAGSYFLTVKTAEQAAAAGRYEINVREIRAATETDRNSAAAFLQHLRGKKLHADGKYDEALSAEEKSLAMFEQTVGEDSTDVADIVNEIALIYDDKGDYPKAALNYNRALGIYEKIYGAEHPFVASVLNNIGAISRATGDFEKAEASYRRALTIDEKKFGAENLKVSTILGNLAYLYYVKGEYSRAEEPYRRALAIEEKLLAADDFDVAITINNTALLYRVKGDYARAIASFQRAAAIAEKALPPDHPNLAAMLSNLASAYGDIGDYERAEPLLQRALKIREKASGAESPDYAKVLNLLGTLYNNQKNYQKAEQFFQRALAIREKKLGAEHPLVAESLSSLAEIFRAKGDYERAEPLLLRALAIAEQKFGGENSNVAPVVLNLGNLYFQKGVYAKAEPLLRRSLAIFAKTNGATHPFTAQPLASLARLYAAKGDAAQALAFQQKYLAIRERNLELNLYTGSERQKLAYIETLSQDLSSTISLHTKLMPQSDDAKRTAFELLLSRKGRTLDAVGESVFSLRRNARDDDRKLIDRLSDTRTRQANLTLKGAGGEKPEQYQAKLKTIEDEREKLEDELSRRSAEYRAQSQPVTLETVRASIPLNAALVEFVEYNPVNPQTASLEESPGAPRYAVYILRPSGEIEWKELGDAETIDRAVAAFRRAARDPKRKDAAALARVLDEKIMQPVRALLDGATQMLISPDGELNLIPFEALTDERNRYLIENYSFTYLTGGRDLLRLQTARASKSDALLIADPQFGETAAEQKAVVGETRKNSVAKRQSVTAARNLSGTYFAPLGGTTAEARRIQALFPDATLLTGARATETALKQANAPRILHIATHGFFLEDENFLSDASAGLRDVKTNVEAENPLMRSGLALAGANRRDSSGGDDGILTALEASGLNLWGTKLVVLSACDTGLGEIKNGEGVYGLRRAFTLAGTETLLMSLWSVSDYATRELMTNYYKNLKRGMGRGESLRQTQLEMLRKKGRTHPFFWAGFIQSGEWANLDGRR